MASTDDEWVPAFEAANIVARKFGGMTRAQQAIALGLREGVLSAATESCTIAQGDEDAEYEDQEADPGDVLEIPVEIWHASDNWESDRLAWDWVAGCFEIEGIDAGVHAYFYGVRFLRSEIESMEPGKPPFDLTPPSSHEPAVSRRGPRPSTRWSALIEAVLKLERDGQLVTGRFDGPGALKEALQDAIPESQQLNDRTIEEVVSHIYDHLLCGLSQQKST